MMRNILKYRKLIDDFKKKSTQVLKAEIKKVENIHSVGLDEIRKELMLNVMRQALKEHQAELN